MKRKTVKQMNSKCNNYTYFFSMCLLALIAILLLLMLFQFIVNLLVVISIGG